MKVTIIYDRIYFEDAVNFINIQTVIFGGEVRYFAQNTEQVNYRYTSFDTLDDVYDFVRYEGQRMVAASDFMFKNKWAFRTEWDMCSWINGLCDDANDLTEIFMY